MKIQIDTTAKTIKIEGLANLGELFGTLEKILPDREWEEYKLETNTVIQSWGNPIYIREPHFIYPWQTWSTGPVYVSSGESALAGVTTSNTFQLPKTANVQYCSELASGGVLTSGLAIVGSEGMQSETIVPLSAFIKAGVYNIETAN